MKRILLSLLIGTLTATVGVRGAVDDEDKFFSRQPKPALLDDEDGDWSGKIKPVKQETQPAAKPIIIKPLNRPTMLSPQENAILDLFEQQLEPIANGLGTITESPDARQAREIKLKERERLVQEAEKRRAAIEQRAGHGWWSGEGGSRPTRRSNWWDDLGGGGSMPQFPLPRYWTPPTTGGGSGADSERGLGSPEAGDNEEDDKGTQPGKEYAQDGKEKREEPGKATVATDTSEKNKNTVKAYNKAINALTEAATMLDTLNDEAQSKHSSEEKFDFAKQLLENGNIGVVSKKLQKAASTLGSAGISEEDKKATTTIKEKSEIYNQKTNQINATLATLLPHILRAATSIDDPTLEPEQKTIKRFLETKIRKAIPTRYNEALKEWDDQVVREWLAQKDSSGQTNATAINAYRSAATTRAPIPAGTPSVDTAITKLQAIIDKMPRAEKEDIGRRALQNKIKELQSSKSKPS